MKEIIIEGKNGKSRILTGECIENLENYFPGKNVIFITDENVKRLYPGVFENKPVIVTGTGEKIKTLDTVSMIYEKLLEARADRSFFIVGVGGGIVCDIAGFAASTYMRGLRFGLVPTTLLAQADAGIGGKNGVNFMGYKNLVGLFSQPGVIICANGFLRTLPGKEVLCGMGELVKYAVLSGEKMFTFLRDNYEKLLNLEDEAVDHIVMESLLIKSEIVNRDERESGERMKLNLGHTTAHAIEKIDSTISHGEAVAAGLKMAAIISYQQGKTGIDTCQKIFDLVDRLGIKDISGLSASSIKDAMLHDKKRDGDFINYVMISDIGNTEIVRTGIGTLHRWIDSAIPLLNKNRIE